MTAPWCGPHGDPYKPHEQAKLSSTENGIVPDAEAVL